MTFASIYINQFHELTSRPACCWACASAALSFSVSSVCSAASGAVRCSCPTISTRQRNCKEALLCTLKIWLNICSRISITYIMPQGFPATTLGFSHPGPTACNSTTLSLSCWTWRPRGCKKLKICWIIGWICCIRHHPIQPSQSLLLSNIKGSVRFYFRKWRKQHSFLSAGSFLCIYKYIYIYTVYIYILYIYIPLY